MIASITTGSKFKHLIDYLLKPSKQPELIGGSNTGSTAAEIVANFELVAAFRPTTKKPVKHFVISFAPEDGQLDSRTKYKIAKETVESMGYRCNQWVAVAHHRNDPDHYEAHNHDHIHIAVNMITHTGQRISDSFDKWKMQTVMRNLELKYQLKQVANSLDRVRRRPQQGRYKKFEKAYYEYLNTAKEYLDNPLAKLQPPKLPREPEIQELETLILAASDDKPTMSEFLARMQELGYRV